MRHVPLAGREVAFYFVTRRDVDDRSSDAPVPFAAWTAAREWLHDHPTAHRTNITITHPLHTMEEDTRFTFRRPLVEARFGGAL